jgi:hypothetical protein
VAFWIITSCCLRDGDKVLEENAAFHHHDRNSAMQTKAVRSSKTLFPVHLTTMCHNPEDGDMNSFSGWNSSVI